MPLPWPAIRRVLLASATGLALLWAAIPDFVGAHPHGRAGADEAAAIATLHITHSAQERFRSERQADRDRDGVAEFGDFAMLAGVAPCPGTGRRWEPAGLRSMFGEPPDGIVTRSAYRLQLFLPGHDGAWVPAGSPQVDPAGAARDFLVLAWPLAGRGRGALYLRADGTVYRHANRDRRFEAPARPLRPADCTEANGFTPHR